MGRSGAKRAQDRGGAPSLALCEAIRHDITLLCDEAELERITVRNIDDEALQLCPDDQLPLDMDKSELFALRIKRATEFLSKKGNKSPYDAVIVDCLLYTSDAADE